MRLGREKSGQRGSESERNKIDYIFYMLREGKNTYTVEKYREESFPTHQHKYVRHEEKTEWMVREGGHKRYKNNNNNSKNAESAEQGVGKFMCTYNMRRTVKKQNHPPHIKHNFPIYISLDPFTPSSCIHIRTNS